MSCVKVSRAPCSLCIVRFLTAGRYQGDRADSAMHNINGFWKRQLYLCAYPNWLSSASKYPQRKEVPTHLGIPQGGIGLVSWTTATLSSMRIETSAHLASTRPGWVESTKKSKPGVPKPKRRAALPYIILDYHISKTEALHLLGRIVYNVKRPLELYVPSGASMCASHTRHAGKSIISGSSHNLETLVTAQDAHPHLDPALFVLPNLPYL